MNNLVWLRNDLRLTDHTALSRASECEGQLHLAWAACLEQHREHGHGANKLAFMLRNAQALLEQANKKNLALHVLSETTFDELPEALLHLMQEHNCTRLFFNREFELNERTRDEQVTTHIQQAGLNVHTFTDNVFLSPASISTQQNKPYKVFTPFKKAWLSVAADTPLSCHQLNDSLPSTDNAQAINQQGKQQLQRWLEDWRSDVQEHWPAGEDAAQKRLANFFRHGVDDYRDNRDCPAVDGTSQLSPYLAIGVISVRQCLSMIANRDSNWTQLEKSGVSVWRDELIWREFYRYVAYHFPRVCRQQPFLEYTRSLRWRTSDNDFAAWQQGKTGVPIVDAAMKQLQQIGWMHNRLRMIVASFLCKNLFLDWRRGEAYFMEQLVDGDVSANNGGWQWSASVGTDAAPYFRVFNPVSQSEKYDPEGEFIRHFLPELQQLNNKQIHAPWLHEDVDLSVLDYPKPLVDLKESRQHAIEKFKSLKKD